MVVITSKPGSPPATPTGDAETPPADDRPTPFHAVRAGLDDVANNRAVDREPGWVRSSESTALGWRDLPRHAVPQRRPLVAVVDAVRGREQTASLAHHVLVGIRRAGVAVRGWGVGGGGSEVIDEVPYEAAFRRRTALDAQPDRLARWLDELLPVALKRLEAAVVLAGLDLRLTTTAAAVRAAVATSTPVILRLRPQTMEALLAADLPARAARVVVPSSELEQRVIDAGIDPGRLAVIPDPVDTDAIRPRGPDARLRADLGLADPLVGVIVGRGRVERVVAFLDGLAASVGPRTGVSVVLMSGKGSTLPHEALRLAPPSLRVLAAGPDVLETGEWQRLGLSLVVSLSSMDRLVEATFAAAGIPAVTPPSGESQVANEPPAVTVAGLLADQRQRLLLSKDVREQTVRTNSIDAVGYAYAAAVAQVAGIHEGRT